MIINLVIIVTACITIYVFYSTPVNILFASQTLVRKLHDEHQDLSKEEQAVVFVAVMKRFIWTRLVVLLLPLIICEWYIVGKLLTLD